MNPLQSMAQAGASFLQKLATSQVSSPKASSGGRVPDHSSDRENGGGRAGGAKFSGALTYRSLASEDYQSLRNSSRLAYWETAQARAIIDRLATSSIGTGLTLECNPMWELIQAGAPKTDEDRKKWTDNVETRFDLFMKSKELDATGRESGYKLQKFNFSTKLKDGETFAILRYLDNDPRRMSPLTIQFVDPDQVCTPYDTVSQEAIKARGNTITDGIELDAMGREIAIYVQDAKTFKFTRIPMTGSTRRFVLHNGLFESVGQVRGLPLLAPVVHELQKLTDYTVAEIEAAVINAVLAIYVVPGQQANASKPFGGIQDRQNPTPQGPQATVPNPGVFNKPGIIVQNLKAGEDLKSFDTKRPNVNFPEFVKAVVKGISGSVGIPIEVLEMVFGQNYSASRASLILFWMTIETHRDAEASQFDQPIYEAWFDEEVASGRISAPGFDDSPVIRAAWLNASWVGQSMPSIDPLKDAKADTERLNQCATTGERVAQKYNGSDFEENARRRRAEVELIPLTPEQRIAMEKNEAADAEDDMDEEDGTSSSNSSATSTGGGDSEMETEMES